MVSKKELLFSLRTRRALKRVLQYFRRSVGWFGLLGGFAPWGVRCEENKLYLHTWVGYFPREIVKQFSEETGIEVVMSYYASNEELYLQLKRPSGDAPYDLLLPSSYCIKQLIESGKLEPLPKGAITIFPFIDPRVLKHPFDSENVYSVPYSCSVTGILIRRNGNTSAIKAWKDLWDPSVKGRLALISDAKELFCLSALVNQLDPKSLNRNELTLCARSLASLFKQVRVFTLDSPEDLLIFDEVDAAMVWSGAANKIGEKMRGAVAFVWPEEGAIGCLDSLVIPKGARHVSSAVAFINFVHRPEIAASIIEKTGYCLPNIACQAHLPHGRTYVNLFLDPNLIEGESRSIVWLETAEEALRIRQEELLEHLKLKLVE